jgi:hypothetical protein
LCMAYKSAHISIEYNRFVVSMKVGSLEMRQEATMEAAENVQCFTKRLIMAIAIQSTP